jgi:hypothetical protein
MKMWNISKLSLIGILVLSGCSREVADCNDTGIGDLIKSNMLSVSRAGFELSNNTEELQVFEKGKKYIDSFTLTLSNITQEGYKEDANMRTCKAVVEVGDLLKKKIDSMTPTSGTGTQQKLPYSFPVLYSLKGLVDQKDKYEFQQEIGNGLSPFAIYSVFLFQAVKDSILNDELVGTWSGNYICSGMEGATDGAQGPYELPVILNATMEQTGINLTLNRTTNGGGIEKLIGKAAVSGKIYLEGKGMNSEDDKWRTKFEGQYINGILDATGKIETPDGELLRNCELLLARDK